MLTIKYNSNNSNTSSNTINHINSTYDNKNTSNNDNDDSMMASVTSPTPAADTPPPGARVRGGGAATVVSIITTITIMRMIITMIILITIMLVYIYFKLYGCNHFNLLHYYCICCVHLFQIHHIIVWLRGSAARWARRGSPDMTGRCRPCSLQASQTILWYHNTYSSICIYIYIYIHLMVLLYMSCVISLLWFLLTQFVCRVLM